MGGDVFNSDQQMPLSGQKRGYPFSTRGGSPGIAIPQLFKKVFTLALILYSASVWIVVNFK